MEIVGFLKAGNCAFLFSVVIPVPGSDVETPVRSSLRDCSLLVPPIVETGGSCYGRHLLAWSDEHLHDSLRLFE